METPRVRLLPVTVGRLAWPPLPALATSRFRLPHLSPDSPTLPWTAPGALTHVLPPSLIAPFLGVILEGLIRDQGPSHLLHPSRKPHDTR